MRFLHQIGLTLGTRVALLALGVATEAVLATALGPEAYGTFSLATVFALTAVQFADLGSHSASAYYSAREPRRLDAILGSIAVAAGVAAIAVAVALLAFGTGIPGAPRGVEPSTLVFALAAVPFLVLTLSLQRVLLGLQRVAGYNFVELGVKAFYLVAVWTVLHATDGGVRGAVASWALQGVALAAFCAWAVRRAAPGARVRVERFTLGEMIRYGLRPWTTCLLAFAIARWNLFALRVHAPVEASGHYALCLRIGDLLLTVPAVLGLLLLPRVASGEGSPDSTARVSRVTVLVLGAASLLVFVAAGPLLRLAFGPEYEAASVPLRILLPGIVLVGVQSIFSNHLAGRGYPAALVGVWILAAALAAGLNALWVPRFGASGAAAATTVTYAFAFAGVLVRFLRDTSGRASAYLVPRAEDVSRGLELLRVARRSETA